MTGRRHSLEEELAELERRDPTVREAKRKYDAAVQSIVAKPGAGVEDVPDEEICVGDFVRILGSWRRVTEIRPYRGPLDFVIGIAETVPGQGFSLCAGSWTTRLKR